MKAILGTHLFKSFGGAHLSFFVFILLERLLQIGKGKRVRIGGTNTSNSFFTLKPIPADTFTCAYAPTAAVCHHNRCRDGDYSIIIQGEGHPVDVKGAENQ